MAEASGYEVGQRVRVIEQGLHAWEGTIISLKHSRKSGWWATVRRDDKYAWHMTVNLIEPLPVEAVA